MKRLKPILPALCVFCLALLVRIIYNLTVARDYFPKYDSGQYQAIAFNLLDEHCFCLHPFVPIVDRAPLWPWLIAEVALIFGRANIYDRLFLCALGAGTCLFLYLFAHDLFGKRIGFVAGLIACIYPALYIYDGWMYTESLYTFLLIAICYCVLCIQRGKDQQRTRLWIVCGVLLALLSLTRPNGIILIVLFIVWTIFMHWRKVLCKHTLRNVALTTLIACALIAPWTIRNYHVSHSFVPIATGDGTVLLGAYNDKTLTDPGSLGSWSNPLHATTQTSATLKPFLPYLFSCNPVCEIQREDASKNAAFQWIRTHLSSMPAMLVYHLRNLWTPITPEADLPMYRFPQQTSAQFVLVMSATFPIPIFILAALGLLVALKSYWCELLFPCAILLLTLAEALAYYGSARFRAPIEPILVLFAAGALWWLIQDVPGTLRWQMCKRSQKG